MVPLVLQVLVMNYLNPLSKSGYCTTVTPIPLRMRQHGSSRPSVCTDMKNGNSPASFDIFCNRLVPFVKENPFFFYSYSYYTMEPMECLEQKCYF